MRTEHTETSEFRGTVTLQGQQDLGTYRDVSISATCTICASQSVHPSWTNDTLLRIAARIQGVVNEELDVMAKERAW